MQDDRKRWKPVQNFAFGGIANPGQRPFLRGTDRQYLQQRQDELDEFERQRVAYNTALESWQQQQYNPYVEAANAYNQAAQAYNTQVYEPYAQQYAQYEQALNAWNQGPRTTDYAGPSEPQLGSTFDMAQPVAPDPFTLQAPGLPFDEAQVAAYQQQAAQRARRDAADRAVAIDVVSDPSRFNFGSMSITNRFMAKGGLVSNSQRDLSELGGAGRSPIVSPSGMVVTPSYDQGPRSEAQAMLRKLGGPVQRFARGGPVQRFASGGPAIIGYDDNGPIYDYSSVPSANSGLTPGDIGYVAPSVTAGDSYEVNPPGLTPGDIGYVAPGQYLGGDPTEPSNFAPAAPAPAPVTAAPTTPTAPVTAAPVTAAPTTPTAPVTAAQTPTAPVTAAQTPAAPVTAAPTPTAPPPRPEVIVDPDPPPLQRGTGTVSPPPQEGMGEIDLQVVVWGPDGKMYSSPGAARRAGVTNYTSTPPEGFMGRSPALTPELATSLMQRSMTTGVPTSEFNKYGGYDAVKAMYDQANGTYSLSDIPKDRLNEYANTVANTGVGNLSVLKETGLSLTPQAIANMVKNGIDPSIIAQFSQPKKPIIAQPKIPGLLTIAPNWSSLPGYQAGTQTGVTSYGGIKPLDMTAFFNSMPSASWNRAPGPTAPATPTAGASGQTGGTSQPTAPSGIPVVSPAIPSFGAIGTAGSLVSAPGIGAYGPIGTAVEQLPSGTPVSSQAVPYQPLQTYSGPTAGQRISANPNLSPGVIAPNNLGYMVDRLGNRIFSPAMVPGFAKGGEASIEALTALANASNMADEEEGPKVEDYVGQARQMLDQVTPQKRATAAMPRGPGPSRGGAQSPKEMDMVTESLATLKDYKPKGQKSAKAQLRELARQYALKQRAATEESRGLSKNTFGAPTLEKPTLVRESLSVKRFEKGGEAKKDEGTRTPEVTGANRLLDFIAQRVSPEGFPTALRTLLETAQGNKTLITEANFSPEELSFIRDIVQFKGGKEGSIQYKDYQNFLQKMEERGDSVNQRTPSVFSIFEPYGNVQTTLGRFSYSQDPEGNLVVNDTYDFNQIHPVGATQESTTGDYGAMGPYSWIRNYAGEKIPPGHGRQIKVNLGPVKRAEGSPEEGEIVDPEALMARSGENLPPPRISNEEFIREAIYGLQDVPAVMAGAPVDIATMLMRPFGYTTEKPVLGSEWIKGKLTDAGIRAPDTKEERLQGPRIAAELLGSMVNPAAATRGVVRGTQLAGQGIKSGGMEALKQLDRAVMEDTGPLAKVVSGAAKPMYAVPPGAKGAQESSLFTPLPSAEAPFVGRLDTFVSGLSSPVRKDQFLGQLKGKFRDYEIGRAKEALADLKDADKISPSDLLNRIKEQYDPAYYRTQVVQPEAESFYASMDNPYKGKPLGVIHLLQDAPLGGINKQEALTSKFDSVIDRTYGTVPRDAADLQNFRNEIDDLYGKTNPEALPAIREVFDAYASAHQNKRNFQDLRDALMYPSLDPAFKKELDNAARLAQAGEPGMSPIDVSKRYHGAILRKLESDYGVTATRELESLFLPEPYSYARGNDAYKVTYWQPPASNYVEESLAPFRTSLHEEVNDANRILRQVLERTRPAQSVPYRGQHAALRGGPDPISFSRFSEHTTNIPGVGEVKGIYVHELQSDRLDDIRKRGPLGGSAKKDYEEVVQPLMQQQDALIKNFVELRSSGAPLEELSKARSELQSLTARLNRITDRIREGTYSIAESFPGMENSPQVIQQLMAKNAIAAAVNRGDNFVAFPGAESAQSQLYEKLPNNLKQVVKDLGPGFEYRSVTLTTRDGQEIMHPAVVWGVEGAEKLKKQGVPFKKGGLVDKNESFIKAHA